MGCNNSKAGKVGILEVAPAKDGKTPPSSGRKHKRLLKRAQLGEKRVLSGISNASADGLESERVDSSRGFSASSKISKHSADSGIGEAEDLNIISEDSHPDKVKAVESTFKDQPNLELGVVGVKCGSAGDPDRLDEQRILAALRQEGLISKTTSKAQGGVAFEVFEEKTSNLGHLPPIRPPPRLEKLENRRKKQKKPLTEEEIQQKLERAERRRKIREANRAKKLQKQEEKVRETQETTEQEKTATIQANTMTDMDEKERKRELKLLERQRRLQAKAEHAERVRQRKLAAKAAGAPCQQEGEVANTLPAE